GDGDVGGVDVPAVDVPEQCRQGAAEIEVARGTVVAADHPVEALAVRYEARHGFPEERLHRCDGTRIAPAEHAYVVLPGGLAQVLHELDDTRPLGQEPSES